MSSPVKTSNRLPLVWISVFAVVVVLGIAAVLVGRSSNDDATPAKGQTSNVVVAEGSAAALEQFDSTEGDPAVGKTIPTVSGKTLDGDAITIGPEGKAKVIVFAAHWCPHCQREIPLLVDHLKDSPMPSDVELLTVSTGVKPEADNYPPSAWLDDAGWTAPVLADSTDSSAAATFGLSSYPYFVVVDNDGKVVFRISGEISTTDFDLLVKAARTGEPPV
ncbi:hypothetical protein BH10ACT1_BH10ACT1_04360 [soil metagenome]